MNAIHRIWQFISGPHGVTYFVKCPTPKMVWGGFAETPEILERVVENMRVSGNDMYANINPTSRRVSVKASRRDILFWQNVLIDIDPIESTARPDLAIDEVAKQLTLLDYDDAYSVIYSGRGFQMWLHVEPTPIVPTTQAPAHYNPVQIERACAKFLRQLNNKCPNLFGCKVDTSCSDLPRVARLPGTINTKTGRTAVLWRKGTRMIRAAQFVDLFKETAIVERKPITNTGSWSLINVLAHLTERAAQFIIEGVSEPGRHAAAYAAAASLCELGVPEDVAERWLLRGASACNPPLAYEDTLRALTNAYARGKKNEESA